MLLAVLAIASFVLVGAVVGVRMLLLARRTRGLPEALLGAGLCSLVYVTLPAVTVGFALKMGPLWLQKGLFVLGLMATVGFAAVLLAFTVRVFRPESRVAWSAVLLATCVAVCGVIGTASARLAAWDANVVLGKEWTLMLLGVFVLGLGWSGVESLLYWLKLRRRLRIGLADPVVCDRFFLWAFAGLGAVAGVVVLCASLALGWRVINHPVPILAVAFAGFSLSICWWLAFVPPRGYLRLIQARAAT